MLHNEYVKNVIAESVPAKVRKENTENRLNNRPQNQYLCLAMLQANSTLAVPSPRSPRRSVGGIPLLFAFPSKLIAPPSAKLTSRKTRLLPSSHCWAIQIKECSLWSRMFLIVHIIRKHAELGNLGHKTRVPHHQNNWLQLSNSHSKSYVRETVGGSISAVATPTL